MSSPVKIVAHRARGFNRPANSAEAIFTAFQSDVDEIEIDLRRCRDGCWVVNHSLFVPGLVNPFRRLSSSSSDVAIDHGLPLARTVLYQGRDYLREKKLRLELKDSVFPDDILEMLSGMPNATQVIITAWSLDLLEAIHLKHPALPLCLSLVEGLSSHVVPKSCSFLDSLCVVPTLSTFITERLHRLKTMGPKVYVVAHSISMGITLLDSGFCDGILTKDPLGLLQHRSLNQN